MIKKRQNTQDDEFTILTLPGQNTKQSKYVLNVYQWVLLKQIGQGTFGKVYLVFYFYQARGKKQQIMAIKSVFQDKKYKNRQLQIIQRLNHPNICNIVKYFFTVENKTQIYLNLVMNYVPDVLSKIIKENRAKKIQITKFELKVICFFLFKALSYLQSECICHRDLKPHNILVNRQKFIFQICDFGSAKKIAKNQQNVFYICSRYYRSPQLIFGKSDYMFQVDMWSMGCILVEMVIGQPIFPGDSSIQQLIEIIKIIGTPSEQQINKMNIPKIDIVFPKIKPQKWKKVFCNYEDVEDSFINLIQKILVYDIDKRLKPEEALLHPFFDQLLKPQYSKVPGLLDFSYNNQISERIVSKFKKYKIEKFQSGQSTNNQTPVVPVDDLNANLK